MTLDHIIYKCKPLTDDYIQSYTEDILKRHYDGQIPDPPVEIDYLIQQEGFEIEIVKRLEHESVAAQISLDGKTIKIMEKYYALNAYLNDIRYGRFSLSHELSHGLVHKYAIEAIRLQIEQYGNQFIPGLNQNCVILPACWLSLLRFPTTSLVLNGKAIMARLILNCW